jgi:hypothetical protein
MLVVALIFAPATADSAEPDGQPPHVSTDASVVYDIVYVRVTKLQRRKGADIF